MCTCANGCSSCGGVSLPAGAAGIDGLNAFTETTADFTVPSVSSNVTINVSTAGQYSGLWGGVGQPVFIAGAGLYRVVSVTSSTMTLTNTGGVNNAAPTTVISFPAKVSPGGEPGAGTNGADGVAIIYQSTAINSPSPITNAYSNALSAITIPADTLGTVGDMLRIEMVVLCDNITTDATILAGATYHSKIQFGSSTVFETACGTSNGGGQYNGIRVVLDLVVTASNTITPRLFDVLLVTGSRLDQLFLNLGNFSSAFQLPPVDVSGSPIPSSSVTLSNSNDLEIQLKNSNNDPNYEASVVSLTVYKYLKS